MQKLIALLMFFSRNSNFISHNLKDFLIRSLFQYPPIKYLVVALKGIPVYFWTVWNSFYFSIYTWNKVNQAKTVI